jgi:general secretion pathway protein K
MDCHGHGLSAVPVTTRPQVAVASERGSPCSGFPGRRQASSAAIRGSAELAVGAGASAGPNCQRGFALLLVLWTLGLLGLVVAGLAASARSGTVLASNVRGSAVAEAAADGGVQQTIFQLLRREWQPDSSPHRFTIGNAAVVVTIEDQTNRFNANIGSPPMLAALLGEVGLDPPQAMDLARMLVDWRSWGQTSLTGGLKLDRYQLANLPYGPPARPFRTIEEMALVPGMSADLLARLKPYLSVYQAKGAYAVMSRNVAADVAMIGRHMASADYTSRDMLLLIHVTADAGGGAQFARRAVVRISAHPNPGEHGWQLLTWG